MKTQIEFEDDNITYKNISNGKVTNKSIIIVLIILIIVFLLSTLFTILQGFEFGPLVELGTFKRIKKNMSSWLSITQEKTGLEKNKGRLFALTTAGATEFQIIDFDSFYVIGRINPNNYLPEFLRRGNSGPWIINKVAKQDLSAKQFAQYALNKYILHNPSSDHIITCGTDMYNKIGYSGYFNTSSVCERAIEKLRESIDNN